MLPNPQAATTIESEIWVIWAQTGDTALDKVFEIGSQALAVGDTRTALKIFDAIVEKKPKFAEGWNKRATIHYLGSSWAQLQDLANPEATRCNQPVRVEPQPGYAPLSARGRSLS